ncbi:MAG: hypothetical protein R2911_33730 [Caldilineaceae bacterium]
MRLSKDEAVLFFSVMNPLLFFANQREQIIADVETLAEYVALGSKGKVQARDAIYEKPAIIDEFVAQNPFGLDAEQLALAQSWKQFVMGDFYIERYLKKYSIWIRSGSPAKVYAVIGLTDSLADMIHKSHLPLLVKGVLLPFKDRIIYDGFFQPYRVSFGGGVKSDLRETYMAAKQNDRIIESLDPAIQAQQTISTAGETDWTAQLDEIFQRVNKLKGEKVPIQTEAFSLLKAAAKLAQAAATATEDEDELVKGYKSVHRALTRLETAMSRAEIYW